MSSPAADPLERTPRSQGRVARRAQQRRRRRRAAAVALLVLTAGALALGLLPRLTGGSVPLGGPGDDLASAPPPEQRTLLLVRAPQDGGAAAGVTLLAAGPGPDEAAILFLPVGTLVDIPGHGLDRLGAAQRYGGAPLLQASVDNTLGIATDHVAVAGDAALAALLDRLGPVPLEVPDRLVSRDDTGDPSLRFAAGPQHLDGRRLVEYLSFRQPGEEELQTFSRQEQVWRAVLTALAEPADASPLDALLEGGAPQLDTGATQDWLRELFAGLAAAESAGALRQALLPVEAFGGQGPDGGATYRLHDGEAEDLVAELLGASSAETGGGAPLRVEVLNGVGRPGIGQAVHRALQGEGFRIVRTDNARSFDFTETRILVYDEADLAAARRLRELLDVGTISVSRRPQSVVDLTVVVGADFTEREGRPS